MQRLTLQRAAPAGASIQKPAQTHADTGAETVPLLELRGISKCYPGTLANDSVDLTIMPGEMHALVGENGAGKSTLMKCIYGVVRPDVGDIVWRGQPIEIANPAAAQRVGIAMVFQHFSLFETLTVAQNIALSMKRVERVRRLSERITEVSREYHLPIDPGRYVYSLSVGERQRVEIVRCLLSDPQLLIMDEPTSVLTPGEVEQLFTTLRRLVTEGRSVLYISHKLEEVRGLCHRATVMRTARVVGTCDPRTESVATLARMMIGSDPPSLKRRRGAIKKAPCLELNELSYRPVDPFGTQLNRLDLAVHSGEIVGIAGVSGNGQQELQGVLSGEYRLRHADMLLLGKEPVGHLNPAGRRRLGLAFVPVERLGRATVPGMSLSDNTCLTAYQKGLVRRGLVRRDAVRKMARRVCDEFHVVATSIEAEAGSLSGGNLQKFVMGREILLAPKVLVAANPTWGVDVGAAIAIRQALVDLTGTGAGVLLISEDLNELLEICDRIAVIYQGGLSNVIAVEGADRDEIGRWMTGVFDDTPGAGSAMPQDDKGYRDALAT